MEIITLKGRYAVGISESGKKFAYFDFDEENVLDFSFMKKKEQYLNKNHMKLAELRNLKSGDVVNFKINTEKEFNNKQTYLVEPTTLWKVKLTDEQLEIIRHYRQVEVKNDTNDIPSDNATQDTKKQGEDA